MIRTEIMASVMEIDKPGRDEGASKETKGAPVDSESNKNDNKPDRPLIEVKKVVLGYCVYFTNLKSVECSGSLGLGHRCRQLRHLP